MALKFKVFTYTSPEKLNSAEGPSGLDVHSHQDLGGARHNCPWARAQSHYEGRKFLAQNVLNGRLFRYQVLKERPFYN